MSEVFDLEIIRYKLTTSLYESDDVLLRDYLDSYVELNKFFKLMGSVFGFVASDIADKITILQNFLNDVQTSERFNSVKSMVQYEKDEGLLAKKGYTSGCRTLLRLHRGLSFIQKFLTGVKDLGELESTVSICKEAYNETLADHHAFLVRSGARMAMLTMPTKERLLCKVCGDDKENIKKAHEVLPAMLEVSDEVYNRIHNVYALNKLLELP